MSTASEDPSSDQPHRDSRQPGPLAILAATAVGGVVASRWGKAPLLLAAGAAALALLKPKKTSSPPRPAPPAPPAEDPAQSQVEQWLSRQIIREEQAPLVDLSTAGIPPEEPEDDYRPEAFLLEDADEHHQAKPDSESFASLTEPVPQQIQEPEPEMTETVEEETDPPPPPQVEMQVQPPSPVPPPPAMADSAWALGVDPMPSFNEAPPCVAPAGSLFFSTPAPQPAPFSASRPLISDVFSTAPVRQEEIGPPLFFATDVFQGAAFPDEIQVASAFEPVPAAEPPPAPAEPPAQELEPVMAPPPAAEAAPEIQVELAAPGEASFDSPLTAAPPNPWQPEPEVFAAPPPAPASAQMTNTVVEAEIILRPRAPTQNAVIAKSKFAPPSFSKQFADEDVSPPPAEEVNDAHFPIPLQSQHDPKPKPTWRSWWRGD